MRCHKYFQKKTWMGFSLIETMVALIVISVGILGVAKVHSDIIVAARDANKRLAALKLLNRKIEDLKQFEVLQTESGKIAFQDIGNNTGGVVGTGTYNSYTLTWCVNTSSCNGSAYYGDYYYTGYNAVPSTNNSLSAILPNFKKIKVRVSWNNEKGVTKYIENEAIIAAKDVSESGFVASSTANLATSPLANYIKNTITLPDGSTDNGNGTSSKTQNGNTYVFDKNTGTLLSINGSANTYRSIKGQILIDTGNPKPSSTNVDAITVVTTISCLYPYTAGTGNYYCYYVNSFTGVITVGNISTDVACPATYSFVNVTTDQTGKNFFIRKSNCNF